MDTQILFESDQLRAAWHPESGLYWASYAGILDGATASQVYSVFHELLESVPVSDIYGIVLDFRAVTRFHQTNLTATRRESRSINTEVDLSRVPAAMLVSNLMQEQFVKVSSKITGTEHRVRIVWSEDEMEAFFSSFHASLFQNPAD